MSTPAQSPTTARRTRVITAVVVALLLLIALVVWLLTRPGDDPASGSTRTTAGTSSSTSAAELYPADADLDAAAVAVLAAYSGRQARTCELLEPWTARQIEESEQLCSKGTGTAPADAAGITKVASRSCEQGTGTFIAHVDSAVPFDGRQFITVGLQKENGQWLATGWTSNNSADPEKTLAQVCERERYEGPPTS